MPVYFHFTLFIVIIFTLSNVKVDYTYICIYRNCLMVADTIFKMYIYHFTKVATIAIAAI